MNFAADQLSAVLHGDAVGGSRRRKAVARIAVVVVAGAIYGAAMGSYRAFLEKPAALQAFYVAVKVPLLLLVTTGLALPSFAVINTLLGLRDDLTRAVGLVLSSQAAVAVALASLAPLLLFYYASFQVSEKDYNHAHVANALLFSAASFAGQRWLARRYRPLIEKNPRHRWTLWAWLIVYAFVGIQMGWTLRPFIGHPKAATAFFRDEPLTNAYEVVAGIVWRVLAGG